MPTLTDLQKQLLEVHEIQLQIARKKAVLLKTLSSLENQVKELLQKESALDKLMHQARQTELTLQQQIALNTKQPEPPKTRVATEPINQKLKSELVTLLQGNKDVASRLLKQQQHLNPGRSVNWCLEKVLYDLKRDRR